MRDDDNPYSIPDTDVTPEDAEAEVRVEEEFFGVSRLKLGVMFFATMGAYALVWFHGNWRIRKSRGENLIPLLRTIFAFAHVHGLFRAVHERALEKNIPVAWSPGRLSAFQLAPLPLVFAAVALLLVAEAVWGILFLPLAYPVMFYPLHTVQKTVNEINGDPAGRVNDALSAENWVFILPGFILQLFIAVGAIVAAL